MNKKMNNKGFSLVELIIVIAIMAILIGVLAPAYLKYVEKSRKSTDVDAIAATMNAIETVALDPEFQGYIKNQTTFMASFGSSLNITCTKTVDGTSGADVAKAVREIVGDYSMKSKDWTPDSGDGVVVKGVVDGGRVNFSIGVAGGKKADFGKFASSLEAKTESKSIEDYNTVESGS